jgi:TPR repeat protein
LSDLYDAGESPLGVAHRHLTGADPFYRISLLIAPIALAVAVIAGAGYLVWPSADATAQAPPAVPAAPSSPAAPAQPQSPGGSSASVAQLEALRDRAGSDTSALNALRGQAIAGNAAAEFDMGTLYDPTLTQIPFSNKDISTSVGWYQKAAEHGNATAEQTMGQSYQSGWGVMHNDATAAEWYLKAAQQGEPLAQYQLGLMRALGQGVPKDCEVAKNWLVDAKNLGYKDAAGNLASGVGGACNW